MRKGASGKHDNGVLPGELDYSRSYFTAANWGVCIQSLLTRPLEIKEKTMEHSLGPQIRSLRGDLFFFSEEQTGGPREVIAAAYHGALAPETTRQPEPEESG